MAVDRFDVYLVDLDPTQGKEIRKTRPCLVVSPDEINHFISNYPTRISCKFQGKTGQVVLDQIRTVDKSRLVRRLGTISKKTQMRVISVLNEMFAL